MTALYRTSIGQGARYSAAWKPAAGLSYNKTIRTHCCSNHWAVFPFQLLCDIQQDTSHWPDHTERVWLHGVVDWLKSVGFNCDILPYVLVYCCHRHTWSVHVQTWNLMIYIYLQTTQRLTCDTIQRVVACLRCFVWYLSIGTYGWSGILLILALWI